MNPNKLKLLAIDDKQDNLTSLRAILRDILPECVLLTAAAGPEGIELARTEDPDVILLDIVMPGMDGFEVCRRLKADEKLQSIPVVFLTALGTDRWSRIKALEVGAEAFISKPPDEQELLAQIRAMTKIKVANRRQRLEKEQLAALVDERTRDLELELDKRKKAEDALKKSELHYREIFDQANEGLLIMTLDGQLSDANQAFAEMHGFNVDEICTMNIHNIDVLGERAMKARADIIHRMQAGEVVHFEAEHHKKDGHIFPVHVTASQIKLNDKPFYMAFHQDITEQKRTKDALLKAQAVLQAAMDQSSAGIAIADAPDGALSYVNDAGLLIRGGDRKSILDGIGINKYVSNWQLLDLDGRPLKTDEVPLARAVMFGETCSREFIIRRADNDDRVVSANAAPIRDAHGKVVAGIVVFTDITEHNQAKNTIKDNERRLNFILENSHVGTWELDLNNHTVHRTLIHDRIFGYETLLPVWTYEMFLEHVLPEDRPYVDRSFREATEAHTHWNFECRIRRVDGEVRWIWATGGREPSLDGKLLKMSGIVQDITERKRDEEQLKESKALVDAVVENVPLMIFLKEAIDLRFVIFNKAGEELLGYDRKTFLGKNNLDIFPPEQAAHFMADDRKVLEGKTGILDIPEESIMTAKNGLRILHTRKVCIRGEDGITKYLLGISEDITDRKKAELALHESEVRYRTLFDQAADAICILDLQEDHLGRILLANPATAKMHGYTVAEIENMKITDFDVSESVDKAPDRFDRIRKGESICGETLHVRKDGTVFPIEFRAGPICFDGRQCVLAFTRDITERKNAEAELRNAERHLRSTLDGLSAHIAVVDEYGEIILTNKSYRDFGERNGIEPSTVSEGANYLAVCDRVSGEHSEEAKPFAEGILEVLSGKRQYFELEYPCHSAYEKRWFIGRVTPFAGEGPRRVIVAHENITERKKAEAELKEKEKEYQELIESLSCGIVVHSSDTAIVLSNPMAVNLLGLTKEQMQGKTAPDPAWCFIGEDHVPLALSEYPVNKVLSSGKQLKSQMLGICSPGHDDPIWVLCDGYPVFDSSGRIFQVVVSFVDVSQRKKAEAEHEKMEFQLRQSQKMEAVGQLAGGVAHDFNNMLSIINGYSQMALKNLAPDDPNYTYLKAIQEAGQRSADLTRQLLTFARKQIIAPKILDINETVAGMLKLLRRLIGENIKLRWSPAYNLWKVKMDPSQIDQIFTNLIVNARDAIPGVGNVTIETANENLDEASCKMHPDSVPGKYVVLSVSDNGCGMSKETLKHIFEPFFTTKELGKGTGLGLATVFGIVKQNNGASDVYSEPGIGTTFKIYLPRHISENEESDQIEDEPLILTGTETVLLVEDNESLIQIAKILLERLGYTVLTADNPIQAIKLAEEYKSDIHLLLTDVIMPEMSGKDLRDIIISARPGIKCLFMSGYTADIIANNGVLGEGIHFLQKPFSEEELSAKLRKALE